MGLAVTFRTDHIIERGRPSVLRAPVHRDGELVQPASGTCTVSDATGDVVSTGAIAVLDGVATYTVDGAATEGRALDANWSVEWELLAGADRIVAVNVARNCRWRLYPCISTADLIDAYASLDGRREDAITHRTDLSPYIDEAMVEIEDRLLGDAKRLDMVMSPAAFRRVLRHLALSYIFEDVSTQMNGTHADMAVRQRELYEQAWAQLRFNYADAEGRPGSRKPKRASTVWFA